MCHWSCISDLLLVVLSIFLPPLPVWIRRGVCSADSWINILLCILGYFPGLIHSWYIIAKYPSFPGSHDHNIYCVCQSTGDLEAQHSSNHLHHEHNQLHTHGGIFTRQPPTQAGPSYGALGESLQNTSSASGPSTAPPPYSKLAGKKS